MDQKKDKEQDNRQRKAQVKQHSCRRVSGREEHGGIEIEKDRV